MEMTGDNSASVADFAITLFKQRILRAKYADFPAVGACALS
jgi:hypothetical protein